jgi:hypothetical protein
LPGDAVNPARLLVAKLDRLSRNVAFLSGIMEKVDFLWCDNHATVNNDSTLSQFPGQYLYRDGLRMLSAGRSFLVVSEIEIDAQCRFHLAQPRQIQMVLPMTAKRLEIQMAPDSQSRN